MRPESRANILSHATVTNPLVSVGIPTRNRPEGLLRTLNDISNQTYANLEILISDNASSDPENVEVARRFAKCDVRALVFEQRYDQGPLKNFDFLLSKATGIYFMWAADDD